MYWSCASSTCNWPSRVRAWRAKMSRINWVRSKTRQGRSRSKLRSWVGERSWSNSTRSALTDAAMPAISSTLPEPISVAGSGCGRRCKTSATTYPPALITSSRNSARDSSVSRPVPGAIGAREAEGELRRGNAKEAADRAPWRTSAFSVSTGESEPSFRVSAAAVLLRPNSTPTRTARSSWPPGGRRSSLAGCCRKVLRPAWRSAAALFAAAPGC